MARTIETIAQTMFTAKAADTNLNGLTSTSQTSIWRLWIYIVAACINVFEQLQDLFKVEIEEIAQSARPGTDEWWQAQLFKFQYDSVTAQTLELVDLSPQYVVENENLRIITRCSVSTDSDKTVNLKVAKSDPPEPLSAPELTSLGGYIQVIDWAGIYYNVISADADKVMIQAEVYCDAQYFPVIQTTVEAALNTYLSNVPFDGRIRVAEIEDAIQSVSGVVDVKILTIKARPDLTSYGSATVVFDLATGVNNRYYSSYAGYLLEEDTATHTFADSITYISQ